MFQRLEGLRCPAGKQDWLAPGPAQEMRMYYQLADRQTKRDGMLQSMAAGSEATIDGRRQNAVGL